MHVIQYIYDKLHTATLTITLSYIRHAANTLRYSTVSADQRQFANLLITTDAAIQNANEILTNRSYLLFVHTIVKLGEATAAFQKLNLIAAKTKISMDAKCEQLGILVTTQVVKGLESLTKV